MSILSRLFFGNSWRCAYRYIDEGETNVVPLQDEIRSYKVIDMPKKHWAADPFLFEKDGEIHLFVEYTDTKKRKAIIAQKRLYPNEEPVMHEVYEFSGHTSYPCIFEWNNTVYMIPETGYNRTVQLLYCKEWPNKWEWKCNLLEGINTGDCTPVVFKGQLYLYVWKIDSESKHRELKLGKLDVDNGRLTQLETVCSYEEVLGRPGGHVQYVADEIIRVVQPGNHYYAEKIEFFRVDRKSNGEYTELKCGELLPTQIELDQNIKIIGTHTFNRCGNIEIIDVLTAKTFHWYRPFTYILQKLELFGFGFYDQKQKYINGKNPIQYYNKDK